MEQPGVAATTSQPLSRRSLKIKKIIKNLALCEVILSIVLIILGIVMAILASDSYLCSSYYDYYSGYYTYYYCSFDIFYGGIWCSVLPFISAIFGIKAGDDTGTGRTARIHMGIGITGSISMALLVVLQSVETINTSNGKLDSYYLISLITTLVAFTNFLLLIVSSSYCCCLKNETRVSQTVVYVTSGATGNSNPGAQGSLFNQQLPNFAPHNQQVMTSLPAGYNNPGMVYQAEAPQLQRTSGIAGHGNAGMVYQREPTTYATVQENPTSLPREHQQQLSLPS